MVPFSIHHPSNFQPMIECGVLYVWLLGIGSCLLCCKGTCVLFRMIENVTREDGRRRREGGVGHTFSFYIDFLFQ